MQSGPFGVDEDEFFYQASKYTHDDKLPHVYIACNPGARIGLVNDLEGKSALPAMLNGTILLP